MKIRSYAGAVATLSILLVSAGGAQEQSSAAPSASSPAQTDTTQPTTTAKITAPTPAPSAASEQPAAPAAPAEPAPTPLPYPAVVGPVSWLPPAMFEAGPFGKIAVNGILNGMGTWTGNYVAGDNSHHAALGNGQAVLQKADGWFQFYLQAGAYNLPSLGTSFLETDKTLTNLFSPLPVAFLKLQGQKSLKSTSVLVGELPTLIGAEYTFTFENMNVNRGLLWNQENAINRGIQINQGLGKYFTASFSWNDGFYSNRYSWLTGSLTYTKGPHALSFVGGGNLGQTAYLTAATPVQNNSQIYNVIYTYTKGKWILQPYFQYTNVPTNASIGVVKGASTTGGAFLASYAFKHGISLPVRWEYISSSGSVAQESVNLLYGPGSSATSITVTPTIQRGGFFIRGDLAYVHASNVTPGFAFSQDGNNQHQYRATAEFGFIFGNNIEKSSK